jgi:hypothetical protein
LVEVQPKTMIYTQKTFTKASTRKMDDKLDHHLNQEEEVRSFPISLEAKIQLMLLVTLIIKLVTMKDHRVQNMTFLDIMKKITLD